MFERVDVAAQPRLHLLIARPTAKTIGDTSAAPWTDRLHPLIQGRPDLRRTSDVPNRTASLSETSPTPTVSTSGKAPSGEVSENMTRWHLEKQAKAQLLQDSCHVVPANTVRNVGGHVFGDSFRASQRSSGHVADVDHLRLLRGQ
jgi:hypothetical protein